MKARLSQYYDKRNIVVDYRAVEIYFHAFSAKLTSTSDRQFLAKSPQVGPEFVAWRDNPERTDSTRESSPAQLCETNQVRRERRLVNIHTELHRLQTKFQYIFNLYSNNQSQEKQTDVWYLRKSITYNSLFWHNWLHTRNIFSCSEYLKSQKIVFHFLIYAELLFLLTILPASSYLASIPPAGWHLCYSLATSPSLPVLSHYQGVGFDTTHKLTLQADNRRL